MSTNDVPVIDEEQIARGAFDDKWDEENECLSPSVLQYSGGTSVNRLCVVTLERQWSLMRSEREGKLHRIVEWNVGKLRKRAREYQHPVELTVVQRPTSSNFSHAEIPLAFTRGLANHLLNAVTAIHKEA